MAEAMLAPRRRRTSNIPASGPTDAVGPVAQPQLVERNAVERPADLAELMEVAVLLAGPADEFDAELVGGVRLAEELRFIEPELEVEFEDRRDRAFADSDGADRLGFDEDDAASAAAEEPRQRGRGHPAGGAAADDDDPPDCSLFGHRGSLRRFGGALKEPIGLPVRNPVLEVARRARR